MRLAWNILICSALATASNAAIFTPQSTTRQDEGNACFDMASSIPGLQSITSEIFVAIKSHRSLSITSYENILVHYL